MQYVAGLMFSEDRSKLAMVIKNRPAWQEGLFNAIGGKIEPGESAIHAMVREFEEETGVRTTVGSWDHFITLSGAFGSVVFFRCNSNEVHGVKTMEDEVIQLVDPRRLPSNMIGNLNWIIPLAMDPHIAFPMEFRER